MKNFIQFIKEDDSSLLLDLPAFVMARVTMPQIKDIDHFKNFLSQQNIEYTEELNSMSGYRPTQTNYDKYKVMNIQTKFSKEPDTIKDLPPVIISNDGFVLDGHHRYLAAKNTNTEIPSLFIDLPINKLLKLAFNYQELIDG